jgi:glucose-6-phosphate isomerase
MQLPFQRELELMSLETASGLSGLVDDVVVDGIGGSALGLRCLLSALDPVREGARIHIADSPDPHTVDRIKASCDPSRTLLVVTTKSGSTAETMSIFLSFYEWLPAEIRDRRVVAVTDPESGDLRRRASGRGWPALPVPGPVGGRYSVLSPVGILPAAMSGLDTRALLDGAASIVEEFDRDGMESLPARMASCWLSFFRTHPVHVFFVYSDRLFDAGSWFSQLWAESLGKKVSPGGESIGQTPLACRGPADQHSLVQLFMEGPEDKFFTFLETREASSALCGGFQGYPSLEWLEGRSLTELRSAEAFATASALDERGLPVCRLLIDGPPSARPLGKLFMSMEIATVLTGLALGIDPLDQPGVERGKYLTFKQMGRPGWK